MINAGYVTQLMLPGGISLIDAALTTITATGWSIMGSQYRATQLRMKTGVTTGTYFQIGDTGSSATMWRISGIYFLHVTLPTSGAQINVKNSSQGFIDHCYFNNGFCSV